MRRKHLVALSLLFCACQASAQNCAASQTENPLGTRIARAALHEYSEFNGHRINAAGTLWKFGSVESETELLHDPESGAPDASRSGRFAWRRVWQYWLALDRHAAGEALSRKIISVPGLLENPVASGKATEIRLADLFATLVAEGSSNGEALRQAAVRAALNDSPWSAAFISYLMDQVGLTDRQFRYSSSHWQYIQSAFRQPEGYVYKACDPRRTVPRVGDLLCYSRGKKPLRDFAAWREAVQGATFSAASHCDVVVNVDTGAKKMEVVGGNVFQAVTRRKLKLTEQNILSDSHQRDRAAKGRIADCQPDRAELSLRDKTCRHENLNLQYWGVLLQLQ